MSKVSGDALNQSPGKLENVYYLKPKIPRKPNEPEASVCRFKVSEAYHSDDKKKFSPFQLEIPHLKILEKPRTKFDIVM